MTLIYEAETPTAVIPALSLTLDVKRCSIVIDETRAPYIEATITVGALSESELASIDPQGRQRITVTGTTTWVSPADPEQVATFDLVIHERRASTTTDTVTIVAVSDEAYLIDGGYLADVDDDSLLAYASSLSTITNQVLDLAGLTSASVDLGPEVTSTDLDYFLTTEGDNLIPNPKAATNTTGWVTSTANSTLTRHVDGSGVTWFRATAIGSGNAGVALGTGSGTAQGVPCTAGETYKSVLKIKMSTPRTLFILLRFFNSSGTQVGSDVTGSLFFAPTNQYYILDGLAPAGAVKAAVIVYMSGATAGNTIDVTAVRLAPQAQFDQVVEFFDGDTADDDRYTYEWVGTANGSAAKRIPLDDRDPDLLVLKPGQKWWEYLQPLYKARDLRLWCDENRDWHLTHRSASIAGTVTIDGTLNGLSVEDTVSMRSMSDGGAPLFYTGVVVRYQWTDATGTVRTRYDVAGTAEKVHRVTIERPWPGEGAAAALLAAASGRGHEQDLVATIDVDARPGMALSSLGFGVADQDGRVEAVTLRWSGESGEHGTMTVRPRDLVDA